MSWADDLPVAVRKGKKTYSLHVDHIGRPVLATNQAGPVMLGVSYTLFERNPPKQRDARRASAQELRFPGQWFSAKCDFLEAVIPENLSEPEHWMGDARLCQNPN